MRLLWRSREGQLGSRHTLGPRWEECDRQPRPVLPGLQSKQGPSHPSLMAIGRPCQRCGARFTPSRRGDVTCETCRPSGSAVNRDRRRERSAETWREFYRTPEWKEARREALDRDGHRCTHRERDGRCPAESKLYVHHLTPLSEGGAPFALANLTTLCARHHGQTDAVRLRIRQRQKKRDERISERITE